ncbi:MAG TPA: cyclic nucleotide-binding domain-containing protein [Candidatus Baltobacteraceae bacterium]|nr:cyclic nucleotide-binding domain-containing protein [Candidatus Baltobacteraceae bacterium]
MPDLSVFTRDPDVAEFPAGHRFFSAGETGETMYVVISGEVEISLRGKVLEHVHPGGIFGEMTLVDHHERSADVTALTEVKAAVIDRKRFLDLICKNPYFAIEVMKVMTERLRAFDARL